MINRGLLQKALREVRLPTLVCGLSLFFFEILFCYASRTFKDQVGDGFLQIPFVQKFISALVGSEVAGRFGSEAMYAVAWVHPVVLALVWSHVITICSRSPAGEIDRATADVLFGWPVSRWQVFVNDTVVWLLAGSLVVGLGLMGALCGRYVVAETDPLPVGLMAVVGNFGALYLAVGGVASLISALSDRRGRAVAVTFAILMVSFLLSFLAEFWSPAEKVAWIGILHYYKPMLVIQEAIWPVRDIGVLIAVAVVTWGLAAWWFARRNIATV